MTPRLYGELARLWPALSPPEDYVEEGAVLLAALDAHVGAGPRTLLDLGAGGGHHLDPLLERFEATAVDRSPEMLALLAERRPEVERHVGDLRTVRLGRTFDAVLIHDAIAHMRSEDELRAAFDTAAAHLASGGVLVALAERFRETFRDGETEIRSGRSEGVELTYFELVWDPDPADTTIAVEMVLVVRAGGRVRLERDRHVHGLFPRATWLELLAAAGFDAGARPFVAGCELLVGVRRT